MKTISEVKAAQQLKVNELMTNCGVFWAFSNEQFLTNKTPLAEGEKYVSIGAGGYMPKGKVEAFKSGMKEIKAWYKSAIKKDGLRRAYIIYELNNHEAFYTGDIDLAVEVLGSDYTREEVLEVYRAEYDNQVLAN